ncbi:MAG: helix-turn-helix domain-containing protein [Acidimicrobiales bacterium]
MSNLSVAEVAAELNVSPSQVRRMLRVGTLTGFHVGRAWVVSADALDDLQSRRVGVGRPLASSRAWALLEILDGGDAAWLSPVARSQVRSQIRRLRGADARAWRTALRGREDRYPVNGHRAAIDRLSQEPDVWRAGPTAAPDTGLLVVEATPEFYVSSTNWERLAARLHLRTSTSEVSAYVRIPRIHRSFGPRGPGRAVRAASLLDNKDWRVAKSGVDVLNHLAERTQR